MDVTSTSLVDRPSINNIAKEFVHDAFLTVPEGKTNALLAIYDVKTGKSRLHYAWKANDAWKVGAQVGWSLREKPSGYIGIEASW